MALGFYLLMPFLIKSGLNEYYAYVTSLGLPLLLILIASIVAYRIEGNQMS